MAFSVVLTHRAQLDIDEYTLFIAESSPTEAARWKSTLETLILSLDTIPGRFSIIPESARLKRPYRSVNHHSHRVIFRIDEEAEVVYVVRVYHGARKRLTPADVQ